MVMKHIKGIAQHKDYLKLLIANLVNRFGDSIDCIALTWLIFKLTGDASWSAILFGVNRIPTIFLMPFAGTLVERMNKKRVMIWMDIIRGIIVGGIALSLWSGHLNGFLLVGMTFLISSAEAFRIPASTAIIPQIIEESYYAEGISINSSISNVVELVGTGAAGFIIASMGTTGAIWIDMATFFISALIIGMMKNKEAKKTRKENEKAAYIDELKDGIHYLAGHKVIRYFAVCSVFLNGILVPFNSLQAPLVSELLNTGEMMLSVIGVTFLLGMIIGAALYPKAVKQFGKEKIYRGGILSIGVYYFSFILEARGLHSPWALYLGVGLVSILVGAMVAEINCLVSVEVMRNIDQAYLARVSALMSSAGVAIIPIISFLTSGLTKVFSIEVIFTMAGILDIIVYIILGSKKRISVINIQENKGVSNQNEDGHLETC